MEPAEEDQEGHEEGANEILPGDTFSDSVPALLPGRIASSASLPSRPRWITSQASLLGGTTDGASLLSARAGRGRRCQAGSLRSGSVACWMTAVS